MSDDLGNDEADDPDDDDVDEEDDNGYSRDSSSPLNDASLRHPHRHHNHNHHHHSFDSTLPRLPTLPKELELRPSGGHHGVAPLPLQQSLISVWSKVDLKVGARFGPFPGKIRKDPIPSNFNWKVSNANFCSAMFKHCSQKPFAAFFFFYF